MKKTFVFTLAVLAVIAFGVPAGAGEGMGAAVVHSRDFDRMKELVGVWEGSTDMGKGVEPVKVTYELTSAGNAIVEKFAAGSPHEMITVYYDYDGKLGLTHYCSLGNQPRMELAASGGPVLQFVLSSKTPNLVSLNEMHMHAHNIAMDGKNGMTQTWTLYDKGMKKSESTVKLARKP